MPRGSPLGPQTDLRLESQVGDFRRALQSGDMPDEGAYRSLAIGEGAIRIRLANLFAIELSIALVPTNSPHPESRSTSIFQLTRNCDIDRRGLTFLSRPRAGRARETHRASYFSSWAVPRLLHN